MGEIIIRIPSFEVVKDINSSSTLYTNYIVQTETSLPEYPGIELKVKRRYNDFKWLYKRLKEEFELTKNRKDPIPPPEKIPKKKIFGRFNEDFIEERRKELEIWMNRLAAHPVWPTLTPFRNFLTEPNMMGVVRS